MTVTVSPVVATVADPYDGETQGTCLPNWIESAELPRRAPGRHLFVGCSAPSPQSAYLFSTKPSFS